MELDETPEDVGGLLALLGVILREPPTLPVPVVAAKKSPKTNGLLFDELDGAEARQHFRRRKSGFRPSESSVEDDYSENGWA